MNIEHKFNTLIVGNGFDLNLKLKTSYNDFHKIFKDVFDAQNRNPIPYVEKWKQDGYVSYEKYGVYELFYKIYDNKNNFFIKYFSNAMYNEWNELEKELEKIYLSLDVLLANLDNAYIDGNRYIFNNFHIFPAFHIFDYIDTWREFEFTLEKGQTCLFYDKQLGPNINLNIKKIERIKEIRVQIPKLLYDDLVTFCNMFTLYLNVFTNSDVASINVGNGARIYANYIFSYNYTDFAERLIKPIKTLYLHGEFNYSDNVGVNGWKEGRIVLGIDDKINFTNIGFNRFKKVIIRSMINSDIHSLNYYLDRATSNQDVENNIAIIGHSLDLIDEDSLRVILTRRYSKYYVFYYDD